MNESTTVPVASTPNTRWLRWAIPLGLATVCIGVGVWYWMTHGSPLSGAEPNHGEGEHNANKHGSAVSVEVISPKAGGVQHVCVQPGSIEPYESADLYAKVSGFLKSENDSNGKLIDIGSRVKKGEVIAEISVPEYEAQVQKDAAELTHSQARVEQFVASLDAAKANAKAAKAKIVLVKALLKSKIAYRQFREKQYNRMQKLLDEKAIDARLVDEAMDYMESAVGAEEAAKESIVTTTLDAEAADARVEQAQADLKNAQAQVKVAEAELQKSRELLNYTHIVSPYDGVITKRSFFRGDFIRSAAEGGDKMPLFSVERTDLMRVVIQVPDRDVPFVDEGDEAKIEIDALPGPPILAKVSRCAASEDLNTRTMRTEVDIPNPTGKLRRGMYGRSTIILEEGAKNAVAIPSAAIYSKDENGTATIRVVRNGQAQLLTVRMGTDNGIEAEVLSGLTTNDQVIVRASGPLDNGTAVTVNTKKAGGSGH